MSILANKDTRLGDDAKGPFSIEFRKYEVVECAADDPQPAGTRRNNTDGRGSIEHLAQLSCMCA